MCCIHAVHASHRLRAGALRDFCVMLGSIGGRQSVWLKALDLGDDRDLLSLMRSVDDRTAEAVALHTEVQADLVTAMCKVEEAQQAGDVIVSPGGQLLHESPSRELETAQAMLGVAESKLLAIADEDRQKVVAQARRAVQDRWAAQRREVELRTGDYTFKVRCVGPGDACAPSLYHLDDVAWPDVDVPCSLPNDTLHHLVHYLRPEHTASAPLLPRLYCPWLIDRCIAWCTASDQGTPRRCVCERGRGRAPAVVGGGGRRCARRC